MAQTLGDFLRRARGDMSLLDAADGLRDAIGKRHAIRAQNVSLYEQDRVSNPSPLVVAGLCRVYGVYLREFSEEMADEADRLAHLLHETAESPGTKEPTVFVMSSRRLRLAS